MYVTPSFDQGITHRFLTKRDGDLLFILIVIDFINDWCRKLTSYRKVVVHPNNIKISFLLLWWIARSSFKILSSATLSLVLSHLLPAFSLWTVSYCFNLSHFSRCSIDNLLTFSYNLEIIVATCFCLQLHFSGYNIHNSIQIKKHQFQAFYFGYSISIVKANGFNSKFSKA